MLARPIRGLLIIAAISIAFARASTAAPTPGSASLKATISDYSVSGSAHWTVVWISTEAGTFIKTLRKQGPSSFTSSHWNTHCPDWFGSKGSSTAFDGYTSATAANYSGTNSPIYLTWNCRDATNGLVPDGKRVALDQGPGHHHEQLPQRGAVFFQHVGDLEAHATGHRGPVDH